MFFLELHNGNSQQRIDPRHFMLSDRKHSEPVFSHTERLERASSPTVSDHEQNFQDEHMTRSHETDNIPNSIQAEKHPTFTLADQQMYVFYTFIISSFHLNIFLSFSFTD